MGVEITIGQALIGLAISAVVGIRRQRSLIQARHVALRQAENDAINSRAVDVKPSFSGRAIPLIYGISYQAGIPAFTSTHHDQDASPFRVFVQGSKIKDIIYSLGGDFTNLPNVTTPDAGFNSRLYDDEEKPVIPVGTRNCRRVYERTTPGGYDVYQWICSGDEVPAQFFVWDSLGNVYTVVTAGIVKRFITGPTLYDNITDSYNTPSNRAYWLIQFIGDLPAVNDTLYRDQVPPPIFRPGQLALRSGNGHTGVTGTLVTTQFIYNSGITSTSFVIGASFYDRLGFLYKITAINRSNRRITFSHDSLADASNTYIYPNPPARQFVAPERSAWAIKDPNGINGKNQFLLRQTVIGLGPMDLVDITINDQPSNTKAFDGTFNAFINDYDRPNSYAAVESFPKRVAITTSANNQAFTQLPLFKDISYVTTTFKKSLDPTEASIYPAAPIVDCFVDAKGVSIDAGMVTVLLDIMTGGRYHEPYFRDDEVDFSEAILANSNSPGGSLHQSIQGPLNVFTEHFQRNGHKTDKLYDFNGDVSTGLGLSERINRVLEGAPGVILFRSLEGIWRLSLPQDKTSVAVLTDDDIILNTFTQSWPDTDRYNNVTVTYANVYFNLTSDTVIYADERALSIDGDVLSDPQISPAGVIWPEQAMNIAKWTMLESRQPLYTFTVRTKWLTLEPGDVVTVPNKAGRQVRVRIQSVKLTPTLNIEISAEGYTASDWTRA